MASTYVYIDGFNLYYGATYNTPFKWLNLLQLCHELLPGDTIEAIKYFTANIPGRAHDPDQPIRQQVYFRALKTIPQLTIFLGHFKTRSKRRLLSGSNPAQWVWVDETNEKGSDVNLASHLLYDGFRKLYQVAVVVSNDSDLAEPIRIVSQELGIPVGILNPQHRKSSVLCQHATFIRRIRQADLVASQFPPVMTDSRGEFSKPSRW